MNSNSHVHDAMVSSGKPVARMRWGTINLAGRVIMTVMANVRLPYSHVTKVGIATVKN